MKETKANMEVQAQASACNSSDSQQELEQLREEMKQLRALIAGERIMSEGIMRRAMGSDLSQERKSIWVSIIMALVAIGISVILLPRIGMPMWFSIFTIVFMLVAIAASTYSLVRHMNVDMTQDNLLQVAGRMVRYKQFTYNWLKCSLPVLAVWLYFFFFTMSSYIHGDELRGALCGGAVGLVIGSVLGILQLYRSHKRIKRILTQIEEIRQEKG